ncbi:MAG TPA: ATP-dependent RNA helicase HrpA [Kofleriaceae bacterium]|nr:ATP-dependent RNA helicase HrpA [Kofleriaceae bacterium]
MDAAAPPTPAVLRPGLRLDERVRFPPELPISACVVDIANAIDAHQVVIIAGETGSGKTTQLPKLCLAMGRGRERQIGCTQPRRIAATSVAARVAQELDTQLGELVGYKVRFSDKVKRTSAIKFVTDGMLLAEIQGDPLLRDYDTIIIDEAHERSLNIDFLLGFVKRLLPRRPELRVIISSATLETDRFAKFFGGAPVIGVSGRTFPVEVIYRPPTEDEADLADAVANTVNEITELDPRNDVLVFLPGEREIREAMSELEQRALPHTTLLPLFARLPAADQQRVFQRGGGRRVVLATNVAETSLTIPGIVYVVDTGVARVNRYNVHTGVSQLLVEPVSRASADQRKGRCGRTANGVCFRLYEEQDYASRSAYTDPEIKRVSLAGVILRMKTLRLGDIEEFPFLDAPQSRAITDGYRVLEELGAVDEEGHLTQIGERLGRLPLDPRLGRMILGGRDENALREVVTIAAVLGLQDPRERPQAVQQKADESHRKFREEGSDFAGFLKLWAFWQDARAKSSRRQLQKLCREHFLSYNRMREWEDIYDQLVRVMKELDFRPNTQPASGEQIHRALLPGLLSRIGMWSPESRIYIGARQTKFFIHPSSGLAKKPPAWVMAAELVETSQLFARTVAKIDPVWLEKAGGALCRRSYGDPHWEQKQAQVMAREHVTLYGLPVIKDRSVAYARHDPAKCRELFITHALVRGEYTTKGTFMQHNRRLVAEVQRLRDKARRSDMFADEYEQYGFYDRRLPPTVVSGKTFEQWRAEAEARQPALLHLSLDDILLDEAHDVSPARYPDQLVLRGVALPLSYRFEPGEDDDGITVTVPLAVLPQLDPEVMTWTIPGWHQPKILALLESLPKATRKLIGPPTDVGRAAAPEAARRSIDERAHALAATLKPFEGAMLPALERELYAQTGERIPRDAWDLRSVPAYFDFTYRVVDDRDKVLGTGRDLAELQRTLGQRAKDMWATVPRDRYERTGLRTWDFDALPASVTVDVGGRRVQAYPALVDAEQTVELRLLESPAAAEAATRDGLRRLFVFALNTSLGKLDAQAPATLVKEARRELVLRALDEAFRIADPPRDRNRFQERVGEGRTQLPLVMHQLAQLASELGVEHGKVRALLKPLVGKPGIVRAVVEDVESQLAHITPPELMRTTSIARISHVLRYLKGIQVRLQRQAHDPQKDQQKGAQLVPLWQSFVTRREQLRAKGRTPQELAEVGWLFEELRIQVFAPELKTAVPVSVARIQELLK